MQTLSVLCDRSTLKNAQAPGIPGTGGMKGALLAAALGALAGDADRGLEVLAAVEEEQAQAARRLVESGAVSVELFPQDGPPRLHIEARVETAAGAGRALLEGAHTRLVALERDGESVAARPAWASSDLPLLDPTWEGCSFDDAFALADALDEGDSSWLLEALKTNLIACGANVAVSSDADLSVVGEDRAAVGSLARMQGRAVTIMTSGFSGNQGLVASIPVWVIAQSVGADDASLARALATSHLVGSFVRSFTGVLSPLCNAVHAAGAGAAAGCVRLLGGDAAAAERASKLVLATGGGVVCDGAKPACSLKVGLGASLAIRAARKVARGAGLDPSDGVAGETLAETARNLGRLAHPAMKGVDEELLRMILAKV